MLKALKHEKYERYERLISRLELTFSPRSPTARFHGVKIHARKLYFVGHCDSPARPPSKLPGRR